MTNEEFTQELLMEAESLGIRKEVLELSNKIKQENKFMDINTSIERAFQHIKTNLQEYNNIFCSVYSNRRCQSFYKAMLSLQRE